MNTLAKLFFPISLFIVMLFFLMSGTLTESPVFDEITHLNAGYEFLVHHDFRYEPLNPPLARELIAIPELANRKAVMNDLRLILPRFIVIIFTLSLGLIVYLFSKKLFGFSAAILALFFFAFDPNILSYGHYAQTDLIFTFFYVLTIFLYYLWRDKFTKRKTIIFGIITGLLLSTKTTALPFLTLPMILLLFQKYRHSKFLSINFFKKRLSYILIFLAACLLALWGTYFFTFEPLLGYRYDPARPAIKIAQHNIFVKFALTQPLPLGSYVSTIKQQLVFNYSGLYRKDTMLLGNVSYTGQPGLFFIPLIFIKTPFPLLILFFLTLFAFRKKFSKDFILLSPILSIIFISILGNTTIVYRYILPIVPLIIIYSSQIVLVKIKKDFLKKVSLYLVLIWYMAESFSVFPHYLSYVNLVLGGYKNGYKYVFDSNYDWGQGLIELKNYQENHKNQKLQFAYFGEASPASYGIKYERIHNVFSSTDGKQETKLNVQKNSTIAINETCWYLCGYYKNPILKNKKPEEIAKGSILIFRF